MIYYEYIALIIFFIGFLWLVISLFYERKINQLYKVKENEIKKAKEMREPISFIERRIKKIKEEYNPQIKEIERKRRFILEKLPFLKILFKG